MLGRGQGDEKKGEEGVCVDRKLLVTSVVFTLVPPMSWAKAGG